MFARQLTAELSLRILLPEHARAIFATVDANRDHIRPWLPWVDATKTVEDVVAFIKKSLHTAAEDEGLTAGIFLHDELIGVIDFHAMSRKNARAEMGYWLAKPHEGRGHMTRAVAAFLAHGFGPLKLHRIVIKADVDNTRSRAIPERLGFTLEGIERDTVLRHNGTRTDHAVYSLLATDSRPTVTVAA